MILSLVKRVIRGQDRFLYDSRSGLKVTKTRDHLVIYRHGEMKLWVDLELHYLVDWSVRTQAEVRSFNNVLNLLELSHYQFVRSGRTVLLEADHKFYRKEEYHESFGPESRNYSFTRQSRPT